MVLLEDTRQQSGKHDLKHKWFVANGITVNRCTLVCGDYQLAGKGDVAVDSKKDCLELVGDVQTKQMPKKEIWSSIEDVMHLDMTAEGKALYRIITDDDADRFPEKEITDYCWKHGLSDTIVSQCQHLYVRRHGFFHRGLIRAKQYGVKLYILVENVEGVKSIDDLFRWVNPRSQIYVNSHEVIGLYRSGKPRYKKVQKYPNCMRGPQLAKACLTMQLKYGCQFVFCRPDQAGAIIINLLTEGGG